MIFAAQIQLFHFAVIHGPELCKRDGIMKTKCKLAYMSMVLASFKVVEMRMIPALTDFVLFQAKGRIERKIEKSTEQKYAYKMTEDLLERFRRYCNQRYEKWENSKISLVSMSMQGNLSDLFLMFSGQLQM